MSNVDKKLFKERLEKKLLQYGIRPSDYNVWREYEDEILDDSWEAVEAVATTIVRNYIHDLRAEIYF